jgi:hypothetical protein
MMSVEYWVISAALQNLLVDQGIISIFNCIMASQTLPDAGIDAGALQGITREDFGANKYHIQ